MDHQGIVIEFSDNSGLIKCSQNPQLYFHMSEVVEKKKLELNEKVDFSLAPVSEGGGDCIMQSTGTRPMKMRPLNGRNTLQLLNRFYFPA